ncbi:polysaccharide biosynthesis C-terminal domain-containing protein [Halobacillus trueperi]|uniref:putative polysaccharide biosynthesis protein n=1 Tax=Halobacillus trueperi TaxID=156205 RepID=UPI003736F695
MSKNTFIKSTFILTLATLLSKMLGSLFRIPLQNIAGDVVLGIFTLVYPVYMVTLILSVAGIPIAISKLISEARVTGQDEEIRKIYKTASILGLLFGFVSFSVIAAFSSPISELLGGEESRTALLLVSTSLLAAPYMAVYRGYFQGFDDMNPTAYSQVIEQFVRAGLIILIAYILTAQNFSDEKVAGGIMIGSVAGVLASLLFLRFLYVKSPHRVKASQDHYTLGDFIKWAKTILVISFPIAIGTVTMALLNIVDSFTVPFGLEKFGVEKSISYVYGIYGRGLSLVQIATVFATSVILPLVPLLTARKKENDESGMRSTIELTHRLTHLISWPAAVGLFALAVPLNVALFTNAEGSLVIAILGASSIFTSLTIIGTGVLQGMDYAKSAAWIIIAGVALKLVLNLVFVPAFGLEGAGYTTLIVYLALTIYNTAFIYKRIRFRIFDHALWKIIGASCVMGGIIGFPTFIFSVDRWSRIGSLFYVLGAITVGGLIYALLLYFTKALDQKTLKSMPLIGKWFV